MKYERDDFSAGLGTTADHETVSKIPNQKWQVGNGTRMDDDAPSPREGHQAPAISRLLRQRHVTAVIHSALEFGLTIC